MASAAAVAVVSCDDRMIACSALARQDRLRYRHGAPEHVCVALGGVGGAPLAVAVVLVRKYCAACVVVVARPVLAVGRPVSPVGAVPTRACPVPYLLRFPQRMVRGALLRPRMGHYYTVETACPVGLA